MRNTSAIALGKTTLVLNKMTGRGGTALPGLVADTVSPGLLRHYLSRNFPAGIILITGTNGKTTTARLIANILDRANVSYVHNSSGSNLVRGILSTLLASGGFNGQIDAQMAILEVDEATVGSILDICSPKLIVVTNLFRDQLDRYGEVNTLAGLLRQQLAKVSSKLLLNADDPIVTSLSLGLPSSRVSYFGIEDYPGRKLEHDRAFDIITSPVSDSPLIYSKRYLGHIGQYQSKNNDFRRPKPVYAAEKITTTSDNNTDFTIVHNHSKYKLQLPFGGLYNTYNALAAAAVAGELGIKPNLVSDGLADSQAAFGRVEVIDYHKRALQLLLIKNPTGFNQIIQSFLLPKRKEPVLILINDNFADGRDVSWLWDAAIEDLKEYQGPITVGGIRGYDMALRLKYAGIEPAHIEGDIPGAIEYVIKRAKPGARIFILPTYTAMLQARRYLVKKADIKEFWQ